MRPRSTSTYVRSINTLIPEHVRNHVNTKLIVVWTVWTVRTCGLGKARKRDRLSYPSEGGIDRGHGWGTCSMSIFPPSEGFWNKLVVQHILFERVKGRLGRW